MCQDNLPGTAGGGCLGKRQKKPQNSQGVGEKRFKTKGQDTIKWLIYKIILIKCVKSKRHRTCTWRKRARLESAGYQHSLSFHPHCFPSDLLVPEDDHITSAEVAGHRLSNVLAANNILWTSFFPQPTLKFAPVSASNTVLGVDLFLIEILMKSGMIKQDGLQAGLGYLEGTLLGKVKNMGDSSALNLLPTLAGETLGSWWPSAAVREEQMLLLLPSIERQRVTNQHVMPGTKLIQGYVTYSSQMKHVWHCCPLRGSAQTAPGVAIKHY